MLPHFLRAMYRFRSLPCPAGNRAKRETPQALARGAGYFHDSENNLPFRSPRKASACSVKERFRFLAKFIDI